MSEYSFENFSPSTWWLNSHTDHLILIDNDIHIGISASIYNDNQKVCFTKRDKIRGLHQCQMLSVIRSIA